MEWHALLSLTGNRRMTVSKVTLPDEGVAIEGHWELPLLSTLTESEQVFIAAFVRCHGSIKEMEKMFGISYPTVKNRLNAIGEQLAALAPQVSTPPLTDPNSDEVLDALNRGEINAEEALRRLKQ
ncbi:MAG: DUF2089 domain-containing protein [Armatimonadota bacterium]